MSETVTLIIIMLTLTAIIYTKNSASAESNGLIEQQQPFAKFVKRPNDNLDLLCTLHANHVKFNRNASVSWWLLKTCNLCTLSTRENENDEWEQIDCGGPCTATLTINSTFSSGVYKCQIFPYRVSADQTLQIEIVRTFEIEVTGLPNSPPEILYDTPSNVEVSMNATIILQCKCHSVKQVPKIQWFKQIAPNDNAQADKEEVIHEREISFLENSYRPVPSSGIKKLDDEIYLSKLIINNITENSIYSCAVINYFGYKYRNFMITVQSAPSEIEERTEDVGASSTHSDKSLELFFIPLFLLLVVVVQVSSILYLLVYRSIMKEANKITI